MPPNGPLERRELCERPYPSEGWARRASRAARFYRGIPDDCGTAAKVFCFAMRR
jgi:hypothetical protein